MQSSSGFHPALHFENKMQKKLKSVIVLVILASIQPLITVLLSDWSV